MSDKRRPRAICRNFIYQGFCYNKQCPRAHVPYQNMCDVFEILLKRDDCPEDVRSIQPSTFARPILGRRKFDHICFNFLKYIPERAGCRRLHLSFFQICNSLPRVTKVRCFCPRFPTGLHHTSSLKQRLRILLRTCLTSR